MFYGIMLMKVMPVLKTERDQDGVPMAPALDFDALLPNILPVLPFSIKAEEKKMNKSEYVKSGKAPMFDKKFNEPRPSVVDMGNMMALERKDQLNFNNPY